MGSFSWNKADKLTNVVKCCKIMDRLSGYYWCKIDGRWEVCFYNTDEKAFERTMDDSYTYDEEFDEIDERKLER